MRIAAVFAFVLLLLVMAVPRGSAPVTAAPCDPNYTGACVPVSAGDVNCDQVTAPVKVVGTDIYGLDGDNDGIGCENSSRNKTTATTGARGSSSAPSSDSGGTACSTIFVAGKGVIDSCSKEHSSAARVYPRKPGVPANGCAEACPAPAEAGTPTPGDKATGTPTRAVSTPVPSEYTPPVDTGQAPATPQAAQNCDRVSYPDICVPLAPPYLSCADIPDRNFRVRAPDPHRFDADGNGIGCEQVAGPTIGR